MECPADADFYHCRRCGAPTRPRLMMFYDQVWFQDDSKEQHFGGWVDRCFNQFLSRSAHNFKLVVLEVGCGMNVPSLRFRDEELLHLFPDHVSLIRVNMEYPYATPRKWAAEGVPLRDGHPRVIPVLSGALQFCEQLSREMFGDEFLPRHPEKDTNGADIVTGGVRSSELFRFLQGDWIASTGASITVVGEDVFVNGVAAEEKLEVANRQALWRVWKSEVKEDVSEPRIEWVPGPGAPGMVVPVVWTRV
mmetsp:Transcript_4886/g.10818  ORF Transcript_4886/g.10818 Transcript_4886/m.10818 type:complete len:249 (-) Transcript_4886:66-812(-)